MICPPGFAGVAFGTAAEGDARTDREARAAFMRAGAPAEWAFVSQVHGDRVVEATHEGLLGDGDAIYTTRRSLAVTVATADCVPIAIEGDGFAAVVHAGWRGVAAGVVGETLRTLRRHRLTPLRAAIGPAIGPCCYEVGDEVLEKISDYVGTTTWGTASVDLSAAVAADLGDLVSWRSDRCTMTDVDLYSYRRDRTLDRQVAVAWLPTV
jgi:YfiH family protein